ncbi:MAG: FtsW/RodA/SpoVE family cell cycle protein [Oscillospiraceae bacterium]|jgi:cell division protein FtsW|nr:FtsW/RodA/SpoVE family cell cycle protein [Oscillospiraceae bacterium]
MKYADARAAERRRGAVLAETEEFASIEKRGRMDLPFLLLVLILLSIGVVMVLSASYASAYYEYGNPTRYFTRQLAFAVLGAAGMILVARFTNMTFVRRFSMMALMISIGLLVLVLFVGSVRNGARRWFDIEITTIQPSEIAKMGIILAFSVMMCKYGDALRKLKKSTMRRFIWAFVPFALVLGIVVILLALEPHKSAALIIVAIAAVVMFAGGLDIRLCFAAIVVALIAAVIIVGMAESSYATIVETGGGDYAFRRIVFWLHPEAEPTRGGYQVLQSLYAIGSGGLTGLGLGQSRQKYLYLPEEHNDYIFAIVCEELGYIGALLILALFALLIIRGFWIAMHARGRFEALVATGITGMLAIQVFLNISVVTNLLPCTGISLPFFSYGGSALLMQLAEMGIILAISRDMPITKAG